MPLYLYGNGNTLTVNSAITNNASGGTVELVSTMFNGNTTVLNGNNTYGGGTVVNGWLASSGVLKIGASGTLPAGGLTINGATVTQVLGGQINPTNAVVLNGNGATLTLAATTNTLASISFNNNGGGTAPQVNPTGTLIVSNGLLSATSSNVYTVSNVTGGTLDFNGATGTINVAPVSAFGQNVAPLLASLNITSVIRNSLGQTTAVNVTGGGGVQLSGQSTFSGGLTLTNSSTLLVGASSTNNGSIVTSGPLGTGTLTIGTGSTLLSAGGSYTEYNPVNVQGNFTIDTNSANAYNLTLGGPYTPVLLPSGSTTITVNSPFATGTLGGMIGGSNVAIVKAGLGTLALSNVNTFGGGTIVSSGTLLATGPNTGSPSPLGTGPVTINGGMLQLHNNGGLANNTPILLNNNVVVNNPAAAFIDVNNNGANTGNTFIMGSLNYGSAATANTVLNITGGNSYGIVFNSTNLPSFSPNASMDINVASGLTVTIPGGFTAGQNIPVSIGTGSLIFAGTNSGVTGTYPLSAGSTMRISPVAATSNYYSPTGTSGTIQLGAGSTLQVLPQVGATSVMNTAGYTQGGLLGKYYANVLPGGTSTGIISAAASSLVPAAVLPGQNPSDSSFAVRPVVVTATGNYNYGMADYTGLLKITTSGEYFFQGGADDQMQFTIDGVTLFQQNALTTNGQGVVVATPVGIDLSAGYHQITLKGYNQGGNGGNFLLYGGPDTGLTTTGSSLSVNANGLTTTGGGPVLQAIPSSVLYYSNSGATAGNNFQNAAQVSNPLVLAASTSATIDSLSSDLNSSFASLTLGGGTSNILVTNNMGGQGSIGILGLTTISGTGTTVSPGTGTLYLIGGISDSGTGGLTKTGSGTLILGSSTPGSFGGPLTISTGYLQVAGATALTSGTTTIASGAMIDLNGVANITGNIVVKGTGLSFPSLTPAALYNSNATAASLASTSQLIIGAASTAVGGYGNINLAGTVSDGGLAWTKVGPDMLTLSGSNAVTGTLTVSNGILQTGSALALGSGTTSALSVVISNNAAMDLNGQILTGGKTITLNGVGIANNLGVSTTGGYGAYANTLGALVNTSSTSPATLPAAVALGAAASVGGNSFANDSATPNPTPGVLPAAGDITLSGVVSGGQTLTKVGGDTLFLTNPANTVNLVQVNYGTVVLNGSGGFTAANQTNMVNPGGSMVLDNSGTEMNSRMGGRGVYLSGDFTLIGNTSLATSETVSQGTQNFNLQYGQSVLTLNASGDMAVVLAITSNNQAFTQNTGTAVLRGTALGSGSIGTAGVASLTQTNAFNGTGYQNGAAGAANRGIVPAVLVDTSVTGSGLTFAVYGTNGYTTMGAGDSVGTITATDNVWATSSLTAPNTGSTQINSLTIGSGGGLTINGGTNTINIQSGGLLLASSAGNASISGNGMLTTNGLNTNFYVHTPGTNTLTIASNVYMTGGDFVKADGGQLSLIGNTTYNGVSLYSPVNTLAAYDVNSGTLQLAGGNQTLFQAFTTAPTPGGVGGTGQGYVFYVNYGGVVDLNGTNQLVDNLTARVTTDLTGGTITNSSVTTTSTLRIAPNGNQTWPGNITGNVNLVRDGNNTFTINSPQAYTGSTTLIGGVTVLNDFATLQTSGIDILGAVLRWDNSGIQAMSNRLTSSGGLIPITFDGGDFQFNARGGTFDTASIGNINLNTGSSRIDVQNNNGSATLNIGTISRQTGASITFVAGEGAGPNSGSLGDNPYIYMSTPPALTNGMIGGWAVTMGQDIGQGGTNAQASFATYDPNMGVRGLASYNQVGAGNAGNVFALNGNTHLTGNATLPGTLGMASTTTINSLTMTNGGATLSFTNSTDTLVLQSGGLLAGVDNNARTVGASQGQGNLTTSYSASAGAPLELFIHNGNTTGTNPLTINSNIIDNGSPVSVVLDSMNLQGAAITLAGSNTYTGTTYVNGVIVNLNSAALAVSGTNVIISSATNNGTDSEGAGNSAVSLLANNQINPAAIITVKGGGQFNLNGANQTVANLVFTDNGNSSGASGAALNTYGTFAGNLGAGTLTVTGSVASSTVGVNNPSNLGNVAATFDIPVVNGILNIANATPTVYVDPTNVPGEIGLEMNAVLSTSANVAIQKTGSGILGLGAQTAFSGGINVTQGGVAFGNTLNNAYYGNSRVTLAAGTTFDTRALTGVIGSLAGSGMLENYNLNTAGTLYTGFDNTNATFSGVIASPFSSGLLNVTKGGSGAWTLTSDSSPTNSGTLTVAGGNLVVSGTGKVGFTTYTLNNGGTLTLDDRVTDTSNRLGGAYLVTSPGVATTTTTLRTINFQGGDLSVLGNSSSAVTENLGTVTLGNAATTAGGGVLTVSAANTAGVNVVFNGALSGENAYSTLLIRGDNLSSSTSGANTATVLTSGTLAYPSFSDNITTTSNNTNTISIRADIIGDTSAGGSGIAFVTRDTTTGFLRPLNANTEMSTNAAALTLASTSGFATGLVNFSATSAQTLPNNVEVNSLTLSGSASLTATSQPPMAGNIPQLIVNSGGILATSGTTTINASLTTGSNNNGSCYIHVAGAGTVLNLNAPIMLSTNGLVKADAGTLVFNSPQFYSGGGGTQVNGGLLQLNGGNNTIMVQPTATTPTVLALGVNGGTLDLDGNVQAVGTLSSVNPLPGMGGTITNSSATAAALIVDAGGNSVFGGAIANGNGSISLYKQGNNTLTLASPNSNTGTTYVEGGTLQVRDSGTLSGPVNVNFATLLLDNTNLGAVANRANAPIALNGGVLQFNASEGLDTQSVGAVTVGPARPRSPSTSTTRTRRRGSAT